MTAEQLGWFYEPVPEQLPVVLLVVGLELLVLGGLSRLEDVSPVLSDLRPFDRLFGLYALGAGYLFAALAVVGANYGAYAAFLVVLFRTVEGAAGVQFYYRVVAHVRGGTTPSASSGGPFIVYRLATFFLAVVGLWLFVAAVAPGRDAALLLPADPRFVYTATSFAIAVLGVYWRMRPLGNAYNGATVAGMALGVAGAELYNYRNPATEITVTFTGAIAYAFGFWLVATLWQFGLVEPLPANDRSSTR